MFGWLKSKAKCPVTDQVRAWVDGRMSWIARQFGIERLRCEVILPNNRFFPDAYRPTEEGARSLFGQVCRHYGIAPDRVELRFYKVADRRAMSPQDWWQNAAGIRHNREGQEIVQVEESRFENPLELVATFAHELSHVLLLGEKRLTGDEEDHELVTDLTATALGFGIFLANAAHQSETTSLGTMSVVSTKSLGYMTDPSYAYALAVLSWIRYQGKPPWAKFVRLGIRGPMLETIRWLSEDDELTGQQRGRRFDKFGTPEDDTKPIAFPFDDFGGWAGENLKRSDRKEIPSTEDQPELPLSADEAVDGHEQECSQANNDGESLGHFDLGLLLFSRGEYSHAVEELSAAIEENSDDAEAYLYRGYACVKLGLTQEALADTEQAVRMDPNEIQALFVRGLARLQANLHEPAGEDFDAVIADKDEHYQDGRRMGEAYYNRGLVELTVGKPKRAAEYFLEAINRAPYLPEFYEARAEAYDRIGNHRKAEQDRQEATKRRARPPT